MDTPINQPSRFLGRLGKFIANNWVSWLIEIVVMALIGYFTIVEARKTGEETRAMIARFEQKISAYASEKSAVIEDSVKAARDATVSDVDTAKDKLKSFFQKQKSDE